jgi:cell division protein FtsW
MDRKKPQSDSDGRVPAPGLNAPKNKNTSEYTPERTPARVTKKTQRKSAFIKPNDIVLVKSGIDRSMFVIIVVMLCFGTVMVFSASFAYALEKTGDSYYYIKKQLQWSALGLFAMFVASRVEYRIIRKFVVPAFIVVLGLLALVPFFGISQGQATRWITIGPVRFQPTELMKIALVLFLALFFDTFKERIADKNFITSSIWSTFIPIGILAVVCVLIVLENHVSGTIIMFLIGMVVIFVGGGKKIWFAISGGAAAVLVLVVIFFTDYAKTRLDMWINPQNYSAIDEIWQTNQGLYAVGSGGFLGVGLGNSLQKHMFVSQPQNDFIFAIICEELGFVGALAVIALFVLFMWRGFVIALKAPDTFSSLVVVGIVGKVIIQAILNIAVVTNTIPNTGISLPFFSYGGSSLSILLAEMGVILSISRFSYQQK